MAQMKGSRPKCTRPMSTFRIQGTFPHPPSGQIALRSFVETLPRDDARRLRRLRRCFWGRQFYRRTVAQGKKAVADGLLEQGKTKSEAIV